MKKLLDEITPIISEALDEAKWEEQLQRSGSKLVAIAEAVKDQLSKGSSEPSLQLEPDDPFIIQKQKDARR